jgi:hypothetical protein
MLHVSYSDPVASHCGLPELLGEQDDEAYCWCAFDGMTEEPIALQDLGFSLLGLTAGSLEVRTRQRCANSGATPATLR